MTERPPEGLPEGPSEGPPDTPEAFSRLADDAPVMLWITNPTGRCVYLNRRWFEFTGQTPATGLGTGWLDAVHPDDREPSGRIFLDANTRRVPFQLEYRLRTSNGDYRWAIDAGHPHFSSAGEFLGFVGSVVDISERRAAEDSARHRERHYRALFEAAPVSIWLEDFSAIKALIDQLRATGVTDFAAYLDAHPEIVQQAVTLVRILDVNAHTLLMFEAQSKDELLRSLQTIFVPETAAVFREELLAVADGRPILTAEAPLRTVRGTPLDALFTIAFPPPDEPYDQVIVSLTDVTARKRAEREQADMAERNARLYHEAQDAIHLRNEFLSIAAHELKTPITALRGYAQVVLRRFERGETLDVERSQVTLRAIDQQSRKLARLVEQLLDVARLETGRLALDPTPTDLLPIIRTAAEEAQARTSKHQLTLTLPDMPVVLTADPLRIEQVLANLLDNAIKYSPDGGEVTIALDVSAPHEVVLAVRDHGLGVPADQRGRIFDRYYQGHAEQHYSGLGLGLHISREIVHRHGGAIYAEHPSDGGTRLVVRLPREPSSS